MAQSEKQLANLKRGNPATQFKPGREQVEISNKANEAKRAKRRRHKTLLETVKMVSKLPLDDIGINRAKRSGVDLEGVDAYDLTALTAVVIGQVRAAANGNSQAAQVVADWLDLDAKHKKAELEIERLKSEIEKTKAETDKLKAGQDSDDDDQVLQFIEGMKQHDPADT